MEQSCAHARIDGTACKKTLRQLCCGGQHNPDLRRWPGDGFLGNSVPTPGLTAGRVNGGKKTLREFILQGPTNFRTSRAGPVMVFFGQKAKPRCRAKSEFQPWYRAKLEFRPRYCANCAATAATAADCAAQKREHRT